MAKGKGSKKYSFKAPLTSLGAGHMAVFLPPAVVKALPESRFRTKGIMNETAFSLAVHHRKGGERFFLVGGKLRRDTKLREGDEVKISFELVDPDELELPEELEVTLAQDGEAAVAFNKLTRGLQRSIAYYVSSARSIDTRIKRALEMAHKVKTGTLTRKKS